MKSNIIGRNLKLLVLVFTVFCVGNTFGQSLTNTKINGYRGIWFELNQKYEYGDKYSGALGTYTAKHVPLAIYSPEVEKTFFVYGGTPSEDQRYLLCMIGEFDHKTEMVSQPTVVFDKNGVDDPHDNPSILIDGSGYIWVFISGRGAKRPGYKYKSKAPYSIKEFVQITEEEMTYPQPRYTDFGFFQFFTKYTGVRQLYFETSKDGISWTNDKLLAAIPEKEGEKSGHYQTSDLFNGKVLGTFFNRHPNGNVDKRTDLYYIQSADFGSTWTTVNGINTPVPVTDLASPARAVDYASQNKNLYLKDMGFTADGYPACLYIRSNGHEPGPKSAPYEWCITKWNGAEWQTNVVTTSDHNYDMGSLFISEDNWKIVGPTEKGAQDWGVGGELAIWQSTDKGETWKKINTITEHSSLSHSYVRRPVNYKAPFSFFWADGDSHQLSKSELYFGNFKGDIWKMPYNMSKDYEMPIKIK
ncbi:BNR-4 repeat-containing protein [Arenibacter sp. BSSL-BM3]|uniref:BNR-4 repeat-containing protein n=1 Tax=Arenibacter arenosicollis TaxID=2762274 RepID=A0ABR7QHB8_9FLAO|nr:BNR-4 repeat-containing protein [Arenibacter arenosicollis]MBC8766565.1 BNR-4 repeat-containing protein [Arenibacter arenosicollis]